MANIKCNCGEWSGEACSWSGTKADTVLVDFMPESFRASHVAAGNCGNFPANGASRIRVAMSCADFMFAHDGEWCVKVARRDLGV